MIIKSIRVIRPNTEVDFYEFSLDFISYRLTNYITPGKLKIETSLSEDGLSKISTFIFSDQETKNTYSSDLVIQEELRRRSIYNSANGIKTVNSLISTYQEVA